MLCSQMLTKPETASQGEVESGMLSEMQNAEEVKVGDGEELYVMIYGGMLTFKKGDVVVTITGVISKDELIRIVESMK